jgi:hypothetical protein
MTFCKVITMENSLPRCDQCSSSVTDSIYREIENHGRVKLGKYLDGSGEIYVRVWLQPQHQILYNTFSHPLHHI